MAMSFTNLIPDNINLEAYMEPDEAKSIRPAAFFRDDTQAILYRSREAMGAKLPWAKTHDKFAVRGGEMTIWSGWKGHGKSAMLSHASLHLMDGGERMFIISPEFKPADVLARKARQWAGEKTPPLSAVDGFFEMLNDRLWLLGTQGAVKAENALALCRYAIDKYQVTQIVVDSLMKCGIGTDDYNRQKWFVDQLQTIAHSYGIHMHLVAHAKKSDNEGSPPKMHDVKGTSEIVDMVENVVIVWKNKGKLDARSQGDDNKNAEPDALMVVDSQRNGEGWTGTFQYWFDGASMQYLEAPGCAPVRMAGIRTEMVDF